MYQRCYHSFGFFGLASFGSISFLFQTKISSIRRAYNPFRMDSMFCTRVTAYLAASSCSQRYLRALRTWLYFYFPVFSVLLNQRSMWQSKQQCAAGEHCSCSTVCDQASTNEDPYTITSTTVAYIRSVVSDLEYRHTASKPILLILPAHSRYWGMLSFSSFNSVLLENFI